MNSQTPNIVTSLSFDVLMECFVLCRILGTGEHELLPDQYPLLVA